MYPDIDFCQYPEATCSSAFTEELCWSMALFEWAERIQRYDNDCWNYMDNLVAFVDETMTNDSFIESVGRILSLECHEMGCSPREVRFAEERKENFYTIINDVFDILFLMEPPPPAPKRTTPPTPPPYDAYGPVAPAPIAPTPSNTPPLAQSTPNPTQVQKTDPGLSTNSQGKESNVPTYVYETKQNKTELVAIEGNGAVGVFEFQRHVWILMIAQAVFHLLILFY